MQSGAAAGVRGAGPCLERWTGPRGGRIQPAPGPSGIVPTEPARVGVCPARSASFGGWTCPAPWAARSSHHPSSKAFPCAQPQFPLLQFQPVAPCPVPHGRRESSVSILFIITLQGCDGCYQIPLPLLFSTLTELFVLPFPVSHVSQASNPCCRSPLGSFQTVHILPRARGPRELSRAEDSLPLICKGQPC